jgi:hypothetical protein
MQWRLLLLLSFIGIVLQISVSQAVASSVSSTEQLTYQVDSEPFGVSYEDWTAKWWQWLLSIPTADSPAVDTTGEHCGVGQNGSVWFLAGTTGGKNVRTCTIPSGTAILIPVLNSECSTAEFPELTTEEELYSCAKNFQDQTQQLEFVIDGTNFEQVEIPRIVSPLFNVTFPEDNIFGAPAGMTKAVSDGNWVFLKPLSEGEHEIISKGLSLDVTTTATNTFVSDVTYQLSVQ